ncbi:hypothetical protein SP99_00326 [Enterobacter sp. BIDMC92]|nr:hypothetical protein SP99_00326 [Enterobacter sp. BIDMC92]
MYDGCLRLSVLSISEGRKVESPGKFSFTRGYSPSTTNKLRVASYSFFDKE